MQEQGLGTALQINDLDGLRRGDLVFWNGHVGIMTDSSTLLHANGHHMMVVAEPLREAVDRIAGQLWPDHQPEAALRSVAPRHVDQIVQRLAGLMAFDLPGHIGADHFRVGVGRAVRRDGDLRMGPQGTVRRQGFRRKDIERRGMELAAVEGGKDILRHLLPAAARH